jgi:hypothetical protein
MFKGNDEGGCSTYKKGNNDAKLSIAQKDDVNADIDLMILLSFLRKKVSR